MGRQTIEDWALQLASITSERSTCIRRKAGCVALDYSKRLIATGYNGVPRGFPHCITTPCAGAMDAPGDTSNCYAIHAEINCVINCVDPQSIRSMYITASPCFKCALVLANLESLTDVYFIEYYSDRRGLEVLAKAGINVHHEPNYKRV